MLRSPTVSAEEQLGAGGEAEGEEGEGTPGPGARGGSGRKGKAAGLETGMDVDEAALACEVAITVPLDCPKLLMREIVEKVAADTIMRGVPGGRRGQRQAGCLVVGATLGGPWRVLRGAHLLTAWPPSLASCRPPGCRIEPGTAVPPSPGVSKSYTLEAGPGGAQTLQTDGINIRGVWPHQARPPRRLPPLPHAPAPRQRRRPACSSLSLLDAAWRPVPARLPACRTLLTATG